jgi:DNA-binding transcriptional LysR family regulator
MELFQLEVFLTVAREGSFSRAAEKLYRTQPAVSQAVRRLEKELGEPLFDSSSREGLLTDAGRVLLDYAQKLLNLKVEAADALNGLRELQRGNLTIAANEFTCLYLLPVLGEFRRDYPMIGVTVRRSLASRIPADVANHNIELGVIAYDPQESQLRCIAVYRDELFLVVHPRHPLAQGGSVSIKELGAESFVAHNVSSPYREKVLQAFKRHRTPLNMDVELPTIEAIKKFVSLGNGVALVPGICVQEELTRGELIRVAVRDLRVERRLRLVYRKNAALSHAARAFLKVAESMASRSGGPYSFRPAS